MQIYLWKYASFYPFDVVSLTIFTHPHNFGTVVLFYHKITLYFCQYSNFLRWETLWEGEGLIYVYLHAMHELAKQLTLMNEFESCDSSVIVYSFSLTPTHSQVGIILWVAVVIFDLSGGWDLLVSGRVGLVGSSCTLTLVSKGDISRNSPVCGENKWCNKSFQFFSSYEACLHWTKQWRIHEFERGFQNS